MESDNESMSSVEFRESSCSTEDYDVGEFMARGRGRGRGRRGCGGAGSRGIVRGRRGGESRGRSVGRGCVRGKRKRQSVVQITIDDGERLRQLQRNRKRAADEMIDNLTEISAKQLLKAMAEKMPSVILDVAQELQDHPPHPEEPESPEPDPQPDPVGWPSWCICHHCREMPRDTSKVCCGMRPDLCTSTMPEMELIITDPAVLHISQLYRNDIFARHAATVEDINASFRYAAYRQYILMQYGRLGRGVRRPVPSCCTWYIRDKFPDPNGNYVEYDPIGW